MIDLFKAAQRLQQFCDARHWRSCLIGGIAVARWGETRVTRDVDLSLLAGFGDEDAFSAELLKVFPGRVKDALEFARRSRIVLLKTTDEIGIDVSLAALPYEERVVERASDFAFAPDIVLRTCSAEDLIVMKLFAGRAIDFRDAEGVALRNQAKLDWRLIEEELRPLAEAAENPAIMQELARVRSL